MSLWFVRSADESKISGTKGRREGAGGYDHFWRPSLTQLLLGLKRERERWKMRADTSMLENLHTLKDFDVRLPRRFALKSPAFHLQRLEPKSTQLYSAICASVLLSATLLLSFSLRPFSTFRCASLYTWWHWLLCTVSVTWEQAR